MLNKQEKKLVLECIDHVLEWEQHMERYQKTKIVKDGFGLDIPKTELFPKIKKLLKVKNKLGVCNERLD